jgi:hypothetical protein
MRCLCSTLLLATFVLLYNSWDRKEWFYKCPEDPTKHCFTPKITHIKHNMFVGPAVSFCLPLVAVVTGFHHPPVVTDFRPPSCMQGWNMDHDDGSSQFFDSYNIVYQGGYKYRDGVNRNMTGNLMVAAKPAFQCTGFDKVGTVRGTPARSLTHHSPRTAPRCTAPHRTFVRITALDTAQSGP